MRGLRRVDPRAVGVCLLAAIASAFALVLGLTLASPSHAQTHGLPSPPGTVLGTTQGWLDGQTVTFLYTRDYFCAQPPSSAAGSGCEVGAPAEQAPIGNPDIPELWVLVPIGFTPDPSTLQCPVAGNCVAHPSDIDLSRVFGAGAADVPTPAHSHIIDDLQGGWWTSIVVGITDEDAWNQLTGPDGRSISALRALQAEGKATSDIPSNLFLFFNVLPEGRPN
jgi:hypothetical protein